MLSMLWAELVGSVEMAFVKNVLLKPCLSAPCCARGQRKMVHIREADIAHLFRGVAR
jgi:hypothetical protein